MRSLNSIGKHFVCNMCLKHGEWYRIVIDEDDSYWLFRYYGIDASYHPLYDKDTIFQMEDSFCITGGEIRKYSCSAYYDFHALCDKCEVYSIEGISIDKVREILVDYEI
jgi:hypothetical protein